MPNESRRPRSAYQQRKGTNMAAASPPAILVFKDLKFVNRSKNFKVKKLSVSVFDEGGWQRPVSCVEKWDAADCYVHEIAPGQVTTVPNLDQQGHCLATRVKCVATLEDMKSGATHVVNLERVADMPGYCFGSVAFGITDPPKKAKTQEAKEISRAQ